MVIYSFHIILCQLLKSWWPYSFYRKGEAMSTCAWCLARQKLNLSFHGSRNACTCTCICSYRSCANIRAPSCSLLTGGGKLAKEDIRCHKNIVEMIQLNRSYTMYTVLISHYNLPLKAIGRVYI